MRSRNTVTLSIAAVTAGVLATGLGTSTAHAAEPPVPEAPALGTTAAPAAADAPYNSWGVLTALRTLLLPELLNDLLADDPRLQPPPAPAAVSAPAALHAAQQPPLPGPPAPVPAPEPAAV
ncbi:MAG TPA: hypothetical protein VD903_11500, partial [Pseudonocardia sp.]|nr:hypothetical protein [Pseudonocardia sp.]